MTDCDQSPMREFKIRGVAPLQSRRRESIRWQLVCPISEKQQAERDSVALFQIESPRALMASVKRPFRQFAGKTCLSALTALAMTTIVAAQAPVHYEHEGKMPPGAIGSQRLSRGGPVHGYFQPVEITAPTGAAISPAVDGQFDEEGGNKLLAGMLIGAVYRLRVTNIPLQPGLEVYPTVEVIDRTYPPLRMTKRFPIPIELTQDELELALQGKFVTRVIYVEEPTTALPVVEEPGHQSYFEVSRGDDPLAGADRLGRPVAILRLGGRVPDLDAIDSAFLFGCPPLARYRTTTLEDYQRQLGMQSADGVGNRAPSSAGAKGAGPEDDAAAAVIHDSASGLPSPTRKPSAMFANKTDGKQREHIARGQGWQR